MRTQKCSKSIYRGITTGYNKAFIIDNDTKEELVAKDYKSDEIIKPLLKGRDITRYCANWAGLWLIYSRKGIDIHKYASVYEHLEKHKHGLSKKSGLNKWYELQASPSNYLDLQFRQKKLLWMDMSNKGRFAYFDTEIYCNDKGFIMTGSFLKYLCAILNSTVVTWFMKNTAPTTGMGVPQWKKYAVESIPIPKISVADQHNFVNLFSNIFNSKSSNIMANTNDWEKELDRMVFCLYNLTEKEISVLCQNSKDHN